jgi:predicted GNAT family N-acyltransferase
MSPEYDLAIHLRNAILREPLNLKFTEEQLEMEFNEYQFGVFNEHFNLMACLTFKPMNYSVLKMRQVAVDETFQKKGIGGFMVKQSEAWARLNNFKEIILNARITAVPFYLGLNYAIEGDKFLEVGIPHHFMKKKLN